VVLCGLGSVLVAHLLWPWSAGAPLLFAAAIAIWGLGFSAGFSAQQARLVALAPAQASVSIALNTSATYLGQAVGTAGAGLIIAHAAAGAPGYAALAGMSVPLLAAAIGVSLFASFKAARTAASTT
jgi:DHA1 family inner membrane transport protein